MIGTLKLASTSVFPLSVMLMVRLVVVVTAELDEVASAFKSVPVTTSFGYDALVGVE